MNECHRGFSAADLEAADKIVPVAQPDIHLYPNKSSYIRCRPENLPDFLTALCPHQDNPGDIEKTMQSMRASLPVQSTSSQPMDQSKEIPQLNSVSSATPFEWPKLMNKPIDEPRNSEPTILKSTILRPSNANSTNLKENKSQSSTSVKRTDTNALSAQLPSVSVLLRRHDSHSPKNGQESVQSPSMPSTNLRSMDRFKENPQSGGVLRRMAPESTILRPSNANSTTLEANISQKATSLTKQSANASGQQMHSMSIVLYRHGFHPTKNNPVQSLSTQSTNVRSMTELKENPQPKGVLGSTAPRTPKQMDNKPNAEPKDSNAAILQPSNVNSTQEVPGSKMPSVSVVLRRHDFHSPKTIAQGSVQSLPVRPTTRSNDVSKENAKLADASRTMAPKIPKLSNK